MVPRICTAGGMTLNVSPALTIVMLTTPGLQRVELPGYQRLGFHDDFGRGRHRIDGQVGHGRVAAFARHRDVEDVADASNVPARPTSIAHGSERPDVQAEDALHLRIVQRAFLGTCGSAPPPPSSAG